MAIHLNGDIDQPIHAGQYGNIVSARVFDAYTRELVLHAAWNNEVVQLATNARQITAKLPSGFHVQGHSEWLSESRSINRQIP